MGYVPVVIAVVVLLFDSGSGTDLPLARNVSYLNLDKRAGMEVDFDCTSATYKTVTLDDYIHKHNCFPKGWETFLALEKVKAEIKTISAKLSADADTNQIEPPMPNMFKAFTVALADIRAIIIGQDPTPQPGKATGLAFSLEPTEDPRTVPSVFNMLIELKLEGRDVSLSKADLTPWLAEGVLLLNAALTVNQEQAGSHQVAWRAFTQLLVTHINEKASSSAWILWGNEAQKSIGQISTPKHYVTKGGHPSPIGGRPNNFIGGNYFHCADEFLRSKGRPGITWTLFGRPGVKDMSDC